MKAILSKHVFITFFCAVFAVTGIGGFAKAQTPVQRIEVLVHTPAEDVFRYDMVQIVAESWRELGFDISVTPLAWARISARALAQMPRDFDVYPILWVGQSQRLDPDFFVFSLLHSSQIQEGGLNGGYKNPEMDKLAEKQRTATTLGERKKAVIDAQALVMREQGVTPIVLKHQIFPYNSRDFGGAVSQPGEGFNSFPSMMTFEPKTSRKTLRWGVPSALASLNPLNWVTAIDHYTIRLIYDMLFRIDEKGMPQKWAAEDLKIIDPLTYEVRLRPDMKFHDGQPVTTEDVKFSYEYYRDQKSGWAMTKVDRIKEIKVIDQHTMRFILKEPFAAFVPAVLAELYILPKHIWKDVPSKLGLSRAQDFANEKPIGSGPFKFAYHRKGEELLLNRFEAHFQPPKVDGVLRVQYTSIDGMAMSLEKGEIDVAEGRKLMPVHAERLKGKAHITLAVVEDIYPYMFIYNTFRKPFNDPAVRRALSYAIPRQRIVDQLLMVYGAPATTYIGPANKEWVNTNVEKFDYDMKKARETLKAAGYQWDSKGRICYP
ncbi:MAG: ABC transporter substrate-binding protein [Candidatus Eisenbacteria bacterium]|nr:ABC transporter substrate-binding protein [Candidatus Eisenbacteria bacterium]